MSQGLFYKFKNFQICTCVGFQINKLFQHESLREVSQPRNTKFAKFSNINQFCNFHIIFKNCGSKFFLQVQTFSNLSVFCFSSYRTFRTAVSLPRNTKFAKFWKFNRFFNFGIIFGNYVRKFGLQAEKFSKLYVRWFSNKRTFPTWVSLGSFPTSQHKVCKVLKVQPILQFSFYKIKNVQTCAFFGFRVVKLLHNFLKVDKFLSALLREPQLTPQKNKICSRVAIICTHFWGKRSVYFEFVN